MIAVFGGAFNPPTIAHYEVAKYVLGLPFVKGLLFVPVGDQYKKAELAAAIHRVNMLKVLINHLPGASISKVEIDAKRVLKSVETLERLQLEYPDSDFAFVMGADNLYKLIKWYDYKRLVRKFKLMILNRGEFDVHAFIKKHFDFSADRFIIVDDFQKIDISSSAYRTDPTRAEILFLEVEAYIRKNDLYKIKK